MSATAARPHADVVRPEAAEPEDPNAMALATAGSDGLRELVAAFGAACSLGWSELALITSRYWSEWLWAAALLGLNLLVLAHAVLALAAQHVGVPVSAISPAYSLMSTDHEKLRAMIRLLDPGAIFVAQRAPFAPALSAIESLHRATIIAGEDRKSVV